MQEYDDYDATGLARLIADGEVTPRELVEAAIARAEERNPSLNAFASTDFDGALQQAEGPLSGPFAGVPVVMKDLGAALAGETQQWGCSLLDGHVAERDSYVGQRYRQAGFISLGRTTTPEFAVSVITESRASGITRNPWDRGRITGGSSGGSAAAVAARIVPVGHGNDGAGSIRMPSSITGCVGLKSSRARVSNGPDMGEVWSGLSHEGGITRSVRDAAALLDAISGPFPGDPYTCPAPERPFAQEVGTDPGRLRIGVLDQVDGFAVDSDCVEAVKVTAERLQDLGHEVVDAHPAAMDSWSAHLDHFLDIVSSHVQVSAGLVASWIGREPELSEFDPMTRHYIHRGRGLSAAGYIEAVESLQRYGRAVAEWWNEGYDILLTPTVAGPPPAIGELDFDPNRPEESMWEQYSYFPYTPSFNISGQPAISLPLHRNADGLPIGVHLVAGQRRDDVLIRLASQLEAAFPWQDVRPAWLAN
ncbi:MAG: amidase [Nocardioidaceae bacterium]